jgi:hypothetical protein
MPSDIGAGVVCAFSGVTGLFLAGRCCGPDGRRPRAMLVFAEC